MFGFNDESPAPPRYHRIQKVDQDHWEKRQVYWSCWDKVPQQNRAWFYRLGFVHYDRILAVDEVGDSRHEGPHLLAEFDREHGPFEALQGEFIKCGFGKKFRPIPEKRVVFFPEEFRSTPADADGADEA